MHEARHEIVVVGGGPAGSITACLLASQGFDVALVDKARFPRTKPCGEYMSPGAVHVLNRLGFAQILDTIGAHPLTGMEIVSPTGRRFKVWYDRDGQVATARSARRADLDAAFLSEARRAGVNVRERFVVRDVITHDDRVIGITGSLDGQEHEVRAPITIAADGARSLLARRLGLATAVRWPRRIGLVAYYHRKQGEAGDFGRMHVETEGYCGVAPISPDSVNVAMVMPADALKTSGYGPQEYFERWIAAHPALLENLEGFERVTPVRGIAPIGSRTSRTWFPGGLLVGDAAGFFDPFTGEGLHRAFRGAELASQAAAAHLRNDNCDSFLQAYDARRREAFRWKSAVTTLVQLFVQYPSLLEYALPRLRDRDVPGRTLSNVLGDLTDARSFLSPGVLYAALHP